MPSSNYSQVKNKSMKTEFKDWHLYFGCNVLSVDMGIVSGWTTLTNKTADLFTSGKFKLVLRPISDTDNDVMDKINALGFEISYPRSVINDSDGGRISLTVTDAARLLNLLRKEGFDCD